MPERELAHAPAPSEAKIAGELLGRKRRDERIDLVVHSDALTAQRVEVGIEFPAPHPRALSGPRRERRPRRD